jgi:solute:Na+ symporter, SSS family
VQFGIALSGSFAAAYYAVKHPAVGGLSGLFEKIDPATLAMVPDFGDWGLLLTVMIIPLTIQWWSVWYPGAEPGGGSYIAQRMLASKSESDALKGTLFFNFAHYALRPWPWIIVALASMIVFPQLSDIEAAFPYVDKNLIGHDLAYSAMLSFLPAGFMGLMIAGLLAAYVSTLSTHLNWGTSYLVHDFYRRFVKQGATEKHYVMIGRIVTALLMLLASLLTFVLDSARQSFELLMSIGAGTGLLYLLRWYWWRINAWSEIAAMASSFIIAVGFFVYAKSGGVIPGHIALLLTVAATTIVWVTVTLLSKPADRSVLLSFYRFVQPPGPGWKDIRAEAGVGASQDSLPLSLAGWVLGCTFVYAALFGSGSLLYGYTTQAIVWLVILVVTGIGLARILPRIWQNTEAGS